MHRLLGGGFGFFARRAVGGKQDFQAEGGGWPGGDYYIRGQGHLSGKFDSSLLRRVCVCI